MFAPAPPIDCWGTDWNEIAAQAAAAQIEYNTTHYTETLCLEATGLFGLSAGEVPPPPLVTPTNLPRPLVLGGNLYLEQMVPLCWVRAGGGALTMWRHDGFHTSD
ncbi:MAG: hypothetical protein R3E31_25750 [Chloroflexota bacterium]